MNNNEEAFGLQSKASAPAGELPPLPKPDTYYIDIPNWGREYNTIDEFSNSEFDGYGTQLFTAEQMRAYVLADRAARAAAAPAGHAEPVAWANVRESDGVVVGLSQHPEDTARWMNPRALVFAAL